MSIPVILEYLRFGRLMGLSILISDVMPSSSRGRSRGMSFFCLVGGTVTALTVSRSSLTDWGTGLNRG
eukprot:1535-Amorphochlora_amoeboformis.AAC.1